MNWKESLTKGYKHMTIPRKTVLIFAAVLVLPLLVVTVIWTENQVGKAYRTFETTSASELAQINAGVRSVLWKNCDGSNRTQNSSIRQRARQMCSQWKLFCWIGRLDRFCWMQNQMLMR